MLSRYAPSGVIIDDHLQIVHFQGETERYLAPAPGEASLNLLKMAREGLLLDLRATIHRARKQNTLSRKEGLKIRYSGLSLTVDVEVVPLGPAEAEEPHFLVLFHEAKAPEPAVPPAQQKTPAGKQTAGGEAEQENQRLRKELADIKESLRDIIEEHEVTNQELRAANEEIQSGNEELQSTNEELETAKEELQSTNEELTTLNEELENRNVELDQAINDLNNLLTSGNIPMVMLGRDLRIRTFTPVAEKLLNLRPADSGRPIGELNLGIGVDDLEGLVADVIQTLETKELEVVAPKGGTHLMRIRPYRTAEDKIEGVVLALFDIAGRAERQRLEDARVYAESIVDAVREPLVILDAELRVVSANPAYYEDFRVTRDETEGRSLYELGNRRWDIPRLRTLLEEVIPHDARFDGFQVDHELTEIGRRTMLLNARRIDQAEGRPQLILLAIEDVTDAEKGK
jgi:two-component system CheB/CheR fusion protein